MFKIDSLIAFDLVATHGSFTAAAHENQQTPMAISKQVSKLERELEQALFERTTRRLKLTDFGRGFRQEAQAVINQHQSLGNWVKCQHGEISGELSIVAQSSEFYQETIFPWLAEFRQQYPKLSLKFDLQENVIELEKDQFDIYWGVGEYLGTKSTGLKRRLLWQSQCGVFASPDYLAQYGTPITPDDLEGHHLIGYLHNKPDNLLVLNSTDDAKKSEPQYIALLSPVSTVTGHIELAANGLGIINAGDDVFRIKNLIAQQKLVPILKDYWLPNAEIFVYYHQTTHQQKTVRAFLDFFLSKRDEWL